MPAMPMPTRETTIQAGSGSSREKRAMSSEPTTNPTEVSPSCSPYSNSVAPSSRIENGSSSTFHSPKATNMNAPTTNSERMIGVPNSTDMPDFRLATMTATLASSSGVGMAYLPIIEISPAATRNETASMANAAVTPTVLASRPAPAKPMAVEPKDAIDR